MSRQIIVKVIVEGQTEEKFIKDIIAPFFSTRNIHITPVVLTKKGQKGGDVKYERIKRDVMNFLWQSNVTLVTCFVDYYGLKEWPGKDRIPQKSSPRQISDILNRAAIEELSQDKDADRLKLHQRFLPFVVVHEFEALLFSNSQILAEALGLSNTIIEQVLEECGSPEQINNSPITAPSKRLEKWKPDFSKTADGIAIAQKIGLLAIRNKCPLFDKWLSAIENLLDE